MSAATKYIVPLKFILLICHLLVTGVALYSPVTEKAVCSYLLNIVL